MVKKAVSWVLVGAFVYLWWWLGHRWTYINVKGNEWITVYTLFTLISLVVLMRGARATGTGMFDKLIGTLRSFIPTLPWMALAIIVTRSVAWLHIGMAANPVDHYTHAVVAVLVAGIATALWYGAIENASD
jgi:hypothetical protein